MGGGGGGGFLYASAQTSSVSLAQASSKQMLIIQESNWIRLKVNLGGTVFKQTARRMDIGQAVLVLAILRGGKSM